MVVAQRGVCQVR